MDLSEVDAYIAEIGRVPGKLRDEVIKVGEKGALNIKRDWTQAWSGRSYIGPLSRSVSYDRRFKGTVVEWEIGPDKSKAQGALGNIIEYGSLNNPPIPGGLPALDKEAPRTEQHLSEVLGKVLGG